MISDPTKLPRMFGLAGVTDWLDGYLARRLNQISAFGAFLDPVAAKLMVSTALVLLVQSDPNLLLTMVAVVIIGREIAVSALREWMAALGEGAQVSVTYFAKWKTTLQMIAIAVLFAQGVFEHYLGMSVWGMDSAMIESILNGETEDLHGLRWKETGMVWAGNVGIALLWIAAALTLMTGWDYLTKAAPYLKEDR